jgi:hypothetical protein
MLGLMLTLALAASPVTPPDGTYIYRSNSTMMSGTSTIVVKHVASSVHISENSTGTVQSFAANATATLALGPDLSPTSYNGSYAGAGQSGQTAVTFNGSSASETTSMGGSNNFALGSASHFVIVDGGLTAGFFALPAQLQAWSDSPTLLIVPIYGQSAPVEMSTATPTRPPDVPATDVALSFTAPTPLVEWYDPKTMVFDEVDVPSQSVVIRRVR